MATTRKVAAIRKKPDDMVTVPIRLTVREHQILKQNAADQERTLQAVIMRSLRTTIPDLEK